MLFLLFIIGLPGSGKSTVAQAIVSRHDFVHLSTEDIRAELFRAEMSYSEDCDFTPDQHDKVYGEVITRLIGHLQQGHSVIVDGVYRNQEQRRAVLETIHNNQTQIIPLMYWLSCDEPEVEMRLIKRKQGKTSAPAGVNGYRKIKKEFEEPLESEFVRCDTTKGTGFAINKILSEIRRYKV